MFSLIQKLRDTPIAVVDVETTGAAADMGDCIIEVGVVRIENAHIVAEYQQLIDPGRRISWGITALTGITQAMCNGQPRFAAQLPALQEILRGALIIGHNIRFDLSFLHTEFRRANCDLEECLGRTHVLDTVRIARRQFGRGGNGLQRLARRLGIETDGAHRALADARTTAHLFSRLIEFAGGWDLCLCDAIAQQGGPMSLRPPVAGQSILPLELAEALELRRPVMMEYLDNGQLRTQRIIEPLAVKRRAGELILVAHCQMRQAQRTFKVDRIIRLERIEEDTPDDSTQAPTPPIPQSALRPEQLSLFAPPALP